MNDTQDTPGAPAMSDVKQRLLQERLRGRRRIGESSPPDANDGPTPLSSYQRQIWLADRFGEGQTHYARPMLLEIEGTLDLSQLQRAFNQLVARHEILRTRFPQIDGAPVQDVLPPGDCRLEIIDLSAQDQQDQNAQIEALLAERTRRYPIESEPPFYPVLVRRAADRALLFINMHHIINDAWSTQILVDDLFAAYKGQASMLPPVQPYRRFTRWQLDSLQDVEPEIEFWRNKLPVSRDRKPFPWLASVGENAKGQARYYTFRITQADTLRIRSYCTQRKTTVFSFLMAAYGILLQRYMQLPEVTLGTEVSRRTLPEFERMVGVFINLLPVRLQIDAGVTFEDLQQNLHRSFLENTARKDIPFETLVRALAPDRKAGEIPFVQAFIEYRNYPRAGVALPGLAIREVPFRRPRALFDLALDVIPEGNELLCTLVYKNELLDARAAWQMAKRLAALIESILADPAASVDSLGMLTAGDQALLEQFQHGPHRPLSPLCAHQLIEQTAARYPDVTAVEFEGGRLTYDQLNQQAGRMAAELLQRGVTPGDRVAVCMDRSPELVASILAIWKAGGVYVPLDPASPPARREHILRDAAPCLLLGAPDQQAGFELPDIPTLAVEDIRLALTGDTPVASPPQINAESLAYIFYTSGSTGQPKGVAVEHRSLVNVLQWYTRRFDISPGDRASLMTQVTFDPSLREIFGNLAGGACLCIPAANVRSDPALYWQWIAAYEITISYLPTPLADLILRTNPPQQLSLRYLFFGGDRLASLPNRALPFELGNFYGLTETTINCTAAIYGPDSDHFRSPHVGRPIDNVSIYLLNAGLNPTPPGIPGEIFVAGPGVARGYWNNPELTRDKFLPDPYQPGGRMYRSGDWGRFLEDGSLEYLGRMDSQVKIRGHRVEITEIEAELDRLPGVEKGLARLFESGDGEKYLVGYILTQVPPDEQIILAALRSRLPEALVPRRIVAIPALPFTPNGKYDRNALPRPALAPQPGLSIATPETPLQTALHAIWQDLLQTDGFGIDDNFFRLGGHSLLVTRLCITVEEQLGLRLPYSTVFDWPTIRQLAALLEKMGSSHAAAPQLAQQHPVIAPLAPPQRGMWLLQLMQPGSNAYNVNVCLKLSGTLDRQALRQALGAIVERHEILRTTCPLLNNAPVLQVQPFRPVTIEEYDLSHLPEDQWETSVERIYLERQTAFDLQKELPHRFLLIRCAPEQHQLVVIVHHVVFDGASIEWFIKELCHHYQRAMQPSMPALPKVDQQYSEYASQYHRWLQTDEAKKQMSHWAHVFKTEPPVLELPTDFHRKRGQQSHGNSLLLSLPHGLATSLRAICGRQNVTPFMLLLAAYKTLLFHYTQQTDLCVGVPISLRRTRQQQELIGLYINTLAIRSQVEGDLPFIEYLHRVRRACLEAYENSDIPFDQLVERTGFNRSLDASPLFQVMFQVRRVATRPISMAGLQMSVARLPYPSAKFDLILDVRESDETMTCAFNYNAELFERAHIENMARQFQHLLESIATDLTTPVASLPLQDADGRRRALLDWNDTRTSYPADQTVHQLFSDRAAQTPGAVALVGGCCITYNELEEQSNRLANYLLQRGLQPHERVVVCAESSPEMVTSLLAILKTGAAYVPIDPDYPPSRIAVMLADSQPRFVLTFARWLNKVNPQAYETILLDQDAKAFQKAPGHRPAVVVGSDSPAYIIYTSGSTGKPKGVVVPHRAINRLVLNTDYLQIQPDDVVAQVSNLSFDAATFEVWGALLNGACLALLSRDALLTPAVLASRLREHRVTVMFLTTALFNTYAERHPEVLFGLRCLLFGGEECTPARVRSFLTQGFPGRLLHVYGPTENTTFSTWHHVTEVYENASNVPIGKPIANSQAYILDAKHNLMPPGIPGELYLGGDGLALGYLNQTEFTAERFIPNPLGTGVSDRLYRTGDICLYQPDGSIVFVGRRDAQVKLRGFRVELQEIQAHLQQHPAVSEALVLATPSAAGEKMLSAYITPAAVPIEIETIRAYLRERLPYYMVPASIQWLDIIPLTPNGKIDRSLLPPPLELVSEPVPQVQETLTPLQGHLVEIWQRILETEKVGLHDDFFDLGGHSILIVRMCMEIEEALGMAPSFSQVFEAPTVAELANLLEKGDESIPPQILFSQNHTSPGVVSTEAEQEMPFYWIGSGFWHFQRQLKHTRPVRIPDQGEDGLPVRARSVEELAAAHAAHILALQPEGPYHLGGFSFGGMLAYEIARQLQDGGRQVGLLCLIEPTPPRLAREAAVRQAAAGQQKIRPTSLRGKISRHVTNLANNSMRGRFAYLRTWLAAQYDNRVASRLVNWLARRYHARGEALPIRWRRYYIKNTSEQLSKTYWPMPYQGRMAVVYRALPDGSAVSPGAWALPAQEIDRVPIADCRMHEWLMREPFVLEWMRKVGLS